MRRLAGTGLAIVAAALLVSRPTHAEERRRLILVAGGSGETRTAVKPILDAICARAQGDALKRFYGDVLNVGPGTELLMVPNPLPPGTQKDSIQNTISLALSAIKNGAVTSCLDQGRAPSTLDSQPFDMLVLQITHDETQKVNLSIRQVKSDLNLTAKGTKVPLEVNALGVALSSPRELSAVVGCVAWTFWNIRDWLPDDDCSQWGLPSAQLRIPQVEKATAPPAAVKALATAEPPGWSRRHAVHLAGAGGAVTLVSVAALLSASRQYQELVDRCTVQRPCPAGEASSGKDTVRALQIAGIAGSVVGGALLLWGTSAYLLGRQHEPHGGVTLAFDGRGGASVSAVGRW